MIRFDRMPRVVMILILLFGLLCSSTLLAQTTTSVSKPDENSSSSITESKTVEAPEVPAPAKPFSLGVSYYLLSDYVFRGVNYSEFAREGREKLNHQMTTALDIPMGKDGKYGTFGFDTFFEWYAGQEELNGNGTNLQEIDYTLRYSYNFEQIASKATVGWTMYTYPHVEGVGDNDRTHEIYLKLDHNDAWMWRWTGYQGSDGVLNPSLFFAQDLHIARGQWLELGISHPFIIVKNLTVTPKITFAIDGGYTDPILHGGSGSGEWMYAYTQYGTEIKYDLTELLHLPPWAGTVYVSGMLCFNDTSRIEERNHLMQDEFFGGMSVGWSW